MSTWIDRALVATLCLVAPATAGAQSPVSLLGNSNGGESGCTTSITLVDATTGALEQSMCAGSDVDAVHVWARITVQ
jgi:hypothetical protein